MRRATFEELKRISSEIDKIVRRCEQEGRKMNSEEEDLMNELLATKEELIGDAVYHGYG